MTIGATVKYQGTMERLRALGFALEDAAEHAIRDATSAAEQHAKTTTLWKDRPEDQRPQDAGKHLRESIHGAALGLHGLVLAAKPYALFLEAGTRGHGPVRAPFLRWIGPGGVMIRARWVRGITPRPFMFEARNHGEVVLGFAMDHYSDLAIGHFNQ